MVRKVEGLIVFGFHDEYRMRLFAAYLAIHFDGCWSFSVNHTHKEVTVDFVGDVSEEPARLHELQAVFRRVAGMSRQEAIGNTPMLPTMLQTAQAANS